MTDINAQINAQIKEVAGQAAAEMRTEVQALVKEALKSQGISEHAPVAPGSVDVSSAIGKAGSGAQFGVEVKEAEAKPTLKDVVEASRYAYLGRGRSNEAMRQDAAAKGASKAVLKTLDTLTASGAGALIMPEQEAIITDALRDATVFMDLGAQVLSNLPMGEIRLPRAKTDPTAARVGEGAAYGVSDGSIEVPVLKTDKYGLITTVTKEMFEKGGAAFQNMVLKGLREAVAAAVNLDFIRNTSGIGVKGIKAFADDQSNTFAANGTISTQNLVNDLLRLQSLVRDHNVMNSGKGAYVMNDSRALFLMGRYDSNGYVFKDEIAAGMLMGGKLALTNAIPSNLGGGSDESEVYYGDFDTVVVGQRGGVSFEASEQATITGVGNTWERDMIALKQSMEMGLACRHLGREVAYMSAVTWNF